MPRSSGATGAKAISEAENALKVYPKKTESADAAQSAKEMRIRMLSKKPSRRYAYENQHQWTEAA